MKDSVHERIRERAYFLWKDNGEKAGDEWTFWLQAEREVLAEEVRTAGEEIEKGKRSSKDTTTRKAGANGNGSAEKKGNGGAKGRTTAAKAAGAGSDDKKTARKPSGGVAATSRRPKTSPAGEEKAKR